MRSDPRLTAEEIVCLQMKSPLQFHSLADGFRPARRRGFESTRLLALSGRKKRASSALAPVILDEARTPVPARGIST